MQAVARAQTDAGDDFVLAPGQAGAASRRLASVSAGLPRIVLVDHHHRVGARTISPGAAATASAFSPGQPAHVLARIFAVLALLLDRGGPGDELDAGARQNLPAARRLRSENQHTCMVQ